MVAAVLCTYGDRAGIGPEVTLRAMTQRGAPRCVLVGCADFVASLGFNVRRVDDVFVARTPQTIDVLHEPFNTNAAEHALACLKRAAELCLQAPDALGLMTGPVNKAALYHVGFAHAGQTEYLQALSQRKAVMMLASNTLRTVPITVHVPLQAVASLLTIEGIIDKARITVNALIRDFGIAAPRLACAALNPHAGENGALGREELDILQPACARLRAEGIVIGDPLPADTLFHAAARKTYDAVLCMYHDQALIPLKTLFFDSGVNISLNLPFVRTAPDHGTAYALVGRNLASSGPTLAALRTARRIMRQRQRVAA